MCMMKKLLLFIVFIFVFASSNAQKKQNVYFYKNNNREVSVKDSADFIRVIQEPDSGSSNFNLLEFYPDGKRKVLGAVSAFNPSLKYEGQRVSYYKNGKKMSMEFYEKNIRMGPCHYYYENGTLRKSVSYKLAMKLSTRKLSDFERKVNGLDSIVIYQADSLGQVLVQEGEGHVVERSSDFGGSILEGDYKRGYKHGVWKMRSDSGTVSYKEEFKDGALVSGECEKNGVKMVYTSVETAPDFKGGAAAFYTYIMRNVKYAYDAQRNNIQGKVFLSYCVDVDGCVTDIKIDRKLYPSLDAEAIRVLQDSPRWIPGTERGFPVKVKYNIPVSFSLHKSTPSFREL